MRLKRRAEAPKKKTEVKLKNPSVVRVKFDNNQYAAYSFKVPHDFPKLRLGDFIMVLINNEPKTVFVCDLKPDKEAAKRATKFLLEKIDIRKFKALELRHTEDEN